jgi:hypothetical protein
MPRKKENLTMASFKLTKAELEEIDQYVAKNKPAGSATGSRSMILRNLVLAGIRKK